MSIRSFAFATFTGLSLAAGLIAHADSSGSATLTAKVATDSNLFLMDDAPLAAGQTVASVPAEASAVVGSVALNLGWKWTASPRLALDLGYAPERIHYRHYASENHTDHRFSLAATGRTADGHWLCDTKAAWLVTEGSEETPTFNRLGGSPALGGEPVRSRRSQDVLKASGRLTRTLDHGFVRGAFALVRQDFHTVESATPGCANYVDRGEWSVGPEAGWKLRPSLTLLSAVRAGRQTQADLLGISENYSNTITRWLVGAEATVSPSLKFNFLAGPDVRRFNRTVRAGFDRHVTTTYFEASSTWSPTRIDTVTLTGKQYLWFSGGGRGAYIDVVADLAWKHTFTAQWDFAASANYHVGRTGALNLKTPRDDIIPTLTATVGHALDAHTRLEAGFAYDWSISRVPNTPAREYHRRIATLSCSRRW